MKLYIEACKNCKSRIYIDAVAISRNELRSRFGGDLFYAQCQQCQNRQLYNIRDVIAEPEKTGAVTGGIVGGLIGLIGGPIGLLIAGGIGAAIGSSVDDDEQKKANFFNTSQ